MPKSRGFLAHVLMKNLRELNINDYVINEEGTICDTVEDFKILIEDDPDLLEERWFTTIKKRMAFDAKEMIENYLRDLEENGLAYEDFEGTCMDCISNTQINKVQDALNEITEGESCFIVYEADEEIKIDYGK